MGSVLENHGLIRGGPLSSAIIFRGPTAVLVIAVVSNLLYAVAYPGWFLVVCNPLRLKEI